MNVEKLKQRLVEYGDIQLCKAGYVFTLLMTGERLSNMNTVNAISKIVLDHVGKEYSKIEATRNSENWFCLILRP